MSKLNVLLLLFFLVFLQGVLPAQDNLNIKFGKVKPEDFNVQSALIDSSTNAVVVAAVGKSSYVANINDFNFSLVFTEKRRIKIINKNGFSAATVVIPLYVSDRNVSDKMDDFEAFTYNLEDGKVVETKLPKSSVLTEKQSKNWIYKKFTFPAIKEGSIIEYSYEVKSSAFWALESWAFQGEFPVLWSQYQAGIPEFFKFVTLSQGHQPFFINKIDNAQISYTFLEHQERQGITLSGSVGQGTNAALHPVKLEGAIEYHNWVMKDVPALKEESFTTTLRNSIAKIEFQLNQIVYPQSAPTNYMDSWEKVATDLMLNNEFGVQIVRPNNWMDDVVKDVVKNASAPKEKAQKIYEYVRDNFSFNDNTGIYLSTGLKDVYKNKSGSVADINMLLIAMLKNQHLNAIPVILSTRDHGYTHEYYPLLNRYNYVIAKVLIDSEAIYLDATVRRLAFGKLPSRVYNGQAREITPQLAVPVYFVADSLKERGVTRVLISNMEKGGVEASFSHDCGVYESLSFRNKMTKTLPEDLKKALQQEYSEEFTVENLQIDSLKILNDPVRLRYALKIKSFEEEDIVYFNPMLGEAIKKNPFTAAERYYPVEMPFTIDEVYNLTMEIPKGYQVEELPKSVRSNINEDEGMFEYLISADKKFISMRCRLLLKKATFANEDYQALRDFYSLIVKKEAEQIVFKKIK